MPKIKICGLTRPEDIDAVNEVKPDYIGFVFAPSRRRVTPGEAAAMKERLDGSIRSVGVFVNAPAEDIIRLCRDGVMDIVQLHGDEDGGYMADLKSRIDRPLIKAVRVISPAQVKAAQALPCDYLLLDTYQKDAYGGTGMPFDHGLIPPLEKPFFLAGGLNAGNIAKAALTGAYCLDVSGGAETDGVKDAEKIKALVRIVRGLL
jgi:phosphoribosylanthranilate isomerase